MNYEIGHINFSVKTDEQTKQEVAAINKQKRFFADDEGIAGCPWEDDKPVVAWHTDSYPFVCVLMLSDCTNMVGGETALYTGNGDILKVRGPQMVTLPPTKGQRTYLMQRLGLRRRNARTLHHPSSSSCFGREGAYHLRHIIPTPFTSCSR